MTPSPARSPRLSRSRLRTLDLLRTERGATAVEYALMAGLIAIVIFASVLVLGRNLTSIFNSAATSF